MKATNFFFRTVTSTTKTISFRELIRAKYYLRFYVFNLGHLNTYFSPMKHFLFTVKEYLIDF